ncbi:Thiolase, N-terminal domain-containing protein [Fimicolochytrium jonesii]|uniref:Thiolase, N-terminal domain-containing protein n=1 Tax=Fimicolochytrium jonesii TaxID=1396493 RepID=UPI0022FF41F9|nr:Thiolase, N-terminal domain-containing protein [Fimicolochytrium jonesii]KAI8817420.1 Thiolase, N-terminal domain-containing protein [Fimicolochytrium jonesii]
MSTASDRIDSIANHLTITGAAKAPRSPDDVVIVAAYRTPLCKAGKGAFKETHPEYLLSVALKSIREKTGIDPALVQDIQVGNVCMPGAGVTTSRMAALYAGYPESVALAAVNRQCSSGLATCANIASAIKAGYIDVGIGSGVESMSMYYSPTPQMDIDQEILAYGPSAEVLTPMGITSENVAREFGISRDEQDKFALRSHTLAAKAQKEGLFDEEIIPVTLRNGTVVSRDDGIRPTTAEGLAKLKPAFSKDGSTTAGNASQVTDGAAAVLLMRRSIAEMLGLPVLARWLGYTAVGVPARIMGIGPEKAIPQVLRQVGLKTDDIDIYEINEAFASQCVYVQQKLGIPIDKINPKGGSISYGHPMGATGSRQIATLLPELRRQKKRFGIVSMCVGIGQGVAAVIENEVL